jgi:formylglycine-generating enzyme required for sulfatase activity/energy-coupling factor transporter ATP-binding protein EcfA2
MPTLFISYKRDDKETVSQIAKRLRQELYYDVWIDSDSIPGGEDWRQAIHQGIDKADRVLLMLTPSACASEHVKEEVNYAKRLGRTIVPLQIKRVSIDDLNHLGVEDLNYVDFLGGCDDRGAWDKLLDSLPDVLPRDRRLLDPAFRQQHVAYLRSLFTRYNQVTLTYLLDAAPREAVSLLDVYVPLFLGIRLHCEVKNNQIIDWWVVPADDRERQLDLAEFPERERRSKEFPGMIVDSAVMIELGEKMQKAITQWGLQHGEYYVWRLESEEAIALQSHLVITGDPGSGKSTLLRHLTLCLAGDMLYEGEETQADLNRLGLWPHPAYTPVFIELRALMGTAFPGLCDTVTIDKVLQYIDEAQLKPYGISGYLPAITEQLHEGSAILFLDGLDEVQEAEQPARREQIKALVRLLRGQFPGCRIVVTARPYAYAGDWQLDGFGHVRLAFLEPDRLEELALRLFRVVLGQEGAEQEAGPFKQHMGYVPEALRRSPLFFTLMAAIWLNNQIKPPEERLPVTQDAIYRECVDMLIRRWTRKDLAENASLADVIGLTAEQLRAVLEYLAFLVHSEQGECDTAIFTGGKVSDAVLDLGLKGVNESQLRLALAQRAGVIFEAAPNRFQFAHRSFQEHLSACYLARHYPDKPLACFRAKPALWRTVMALLLDETLRRELDLWKLIQGLLPPLHAALPVSPDSPDWTCYAYAGQVMRDHLRPDDDLQEMYRPRLAYTLAALVSIGALPPAERAAMGRLLAELGDPRPGVLAPDGIPDLVWCEVPAGQFKMGGDPYAPNAWHGAEFDLPYTFWIAKYPVTYAQYEPFVTATGHKPPDYWHNPKWHIANHPVVGVTWQDAYVYTQWLDRLRQQGVLILPPEIATGHVIRLPRECEWEKAARHPDGQLFPWGDEYVPGYANIDETYRGIGPNYLQRTTAVGSYPHGANPDHGACDLSGNVWEWCLTEWTDTYQTPEAENNQLTDAGFMRCARGGAWDDSDFFTRAASRDWLNPRLRASHGGFRVVVSVPL